MPCFRRKSKGKAFKKLFSSSSENDSAQCAYWKDAYLPAFSRLEVLSMNSSGIFFHNESMEIMRFRETSPIEKAISPSL